MSFVGDDVEFLFKKYPFEDSIPDFDKFWKVYMGTKNRKEDLMAEKKGGARIVAWLVAFMLILGVGWFGLTKFALIQKQEKMSKGEAIVVTLVVGDVSVKKMGAADWREVAVEDTLEMGDAIKTGKDSYCELQMVKRGIFRVENSSELYLATLVNNDDKINSRMKLAKGGIALKPNKLQQGEKFEVETSTAVAAVRGTKFSVNVDENGDTKVAVNEGKVALQPVIKSIDEAKDKGQVEANATEALKDQLVKPIEVTPGQEVKMESAKVEALDKAIEKAIEVVAQKEGPITAQMLGVPETSAASSSASDTVQPEEPVSAKLPDISTAIIKEVTKEIPVTATKNNPTADPITASIAQKQEISEEAKKKLDELNENKIIAKAENIIKVKIDSKPSGAQIYIDNTSVGVTPFENIVEKGKKISIRVSKEGFGEITNDYEISGSLSLSLELPVIAVPETNTSVALQKLPGELDWEKPITAKITGGDHEPLLYKGRIFVTVNNRLLILSTEGTVLKSIGVVEEGYRLTRPVASDSKIYVGSDNGGLFAYNITGELAWKADAGSEKYGASPTAAFGLIAVPSIEKGIKVYQKDGTLKDHIEVSVPIYSAPLLLNNGSDLIYATESGEIACYDLVNKTKKWSKNYNERILYPLVGEDMIVALARNSGKVLGIHPQDGSLVWNIQLPELQKTKINPQYVNDRVILANNNQGSTIIVIGASKGSILAKWSVAEAVDVPYVVGDSVYLGTDVGKVYSYNLAQKKNEWTYQGSGKISVVVADKDGIYAVSSQSMVKLIK